MPAGTQDEVEQIFAMRVIRLRAAGFSLEQSMWLAGDNRVNVHDAENMVRDGCHPDLAFEILR